jgi:hypothetical protein
MLKADIKIFENQTEWIKRRKLTLFKNKDQLDNYQEYFLNKLIKNKKKYKPVLVRSSGTSGGPGKKIEFPSGFYENIENHHMWKIMHSHQIPVGNVISMFQGSNDWGSLEPKKIASLGLSNNSWNLNYNPKDSNFDFWKAKINLIKKINPSFLYTSPSVFVSILEFLESENISFNFPIIFSCETLSDNVREKAKLFFSKVIDKMLDWTTGFGFFECNRGTKHVYDELSIVKQKNNTISSKSLFNFIENFEKISDDFVCLDQKMCECGIYGNILKEFQGKIFECLISKEGFRYSSNYVCGILLMFPFKLSPYEIIQTKDYNIEFNTKNHFNDSQFISIANLLSGILLNRELFSVFVENRCVRLTNSNNFIRFFIKEPKLYRHKILCVKSYVT